jgi:hypothetical protein
MSIQSSFNLRRGLSRGAVFLALLISTMIASAQEPAGAARPKVAIFPLAGDASAELREKVGFSLRSKLDRDGAFEVLDGYTMNDAVAGRAEPVAFATDLTDVRKLAGELGARILIWGELVNAPAGPTLRLKVLDILQRDPQPHEVNKTIAKATDLRFMAEEILETLPGVQRFEHPTEVAVQNDATAEALWKTSPNLVANAGFDADGQWDFIYTTIRRPVRHEDRLPAQDEALITTIDGNRVLAMRLSRTAAENNGLAVLSQSIPIQPDMRYRLSFRYRSDGPRLHVFVKGYTLFENINGEKVEREIYRRQVPPAGPTDGQWVTIVDELNPQHVAMPVQALRVDLYAYLQPGVVMFDDVVLKAVGRQTRAARDTAIEAPDTRPAGRKKQPRLFLACSSRSAAVEREERAGAARQPV